MSVGRSAVTGVILKKQARWRWRDKHAALGQTRIEDGLSLHWLIHLE
jgi:hypothetical protein